MDANGCSVTYTYIITEPSLLTVSGMFTNVTCYDIGNGSIDITASGGTIPYTYIWDDFTTDEDRTGMAPGTYTVIVSDFNNCTATASFTITEPDTLLVSSIIDNMLYAW